MASRIANMDRKASRALPSATHARVRVMAAALVATCALLACSPTRFETTSEIPPPLIVKIPVVVGVYLPLEFREKVYEEKRQGGGEYTIGLGKSQTAGFMRIM